MADSSLRFGAASAWESGSSTLLQAARGLVTINSTVGMSALLHGVPVKVIGTAYYDLRGLTYAGTVDDFWSAAERVEVDMELYGRFRSHVIRTTQINGNFSRRLRSSVYACGLQWQTGAQPIQGRSRRMSGRLG